MDPGYSTQRILRLLLASWALFGILNNDKVAIVPTVNYSPKCISLMLMDVKTLLLITLPSLDFNVGCCQSLQPIYL